MKLTIKFVPLLLLLFLFSCKEDPIDIIEEKERYLTELFDNSVKTSDVIYGNNTTLMGANTDLKLDIFEPDGDVLTERPLVIFAHSGYFTSGTRSEFDSLCVKLTKRGYLAATIDYRLWEGGIPIDTANLLSVEVRAMHDMRAAVRFFKNDANNDDLFRVNTNKIILAGYSSGAWMALHAAYLDDLNEVNSNVADTLLANSGIEGNSGHPSFDSSVAGVISISGALLNADMIEAGDAPLLSIHGEADRIMPYCTGLQRDQLENDLVTLDGPCIYSPHAQTVGVSSTLHTISNGNHDSPFNNSSIEETETEIFDFLYDIVK